MKRAICIIAAALALVFALVGCASAPAKATDAESLKGFWAIDSSTTAGFDAAINLEDDDYAELIISDSYQEGTWKAGTSEATVTFEGKDPVNVYVSDGKLFLGKDEGSKLVFVKSDADKYFEAMGGGEDDEAEAEDGSEADAEDSEIMELSSEEAENLGELDGVELVDEVIDDIKPVTIADDDICTIQVTGKGTDWTGDPGYRISIANNYDKTIFVVPNEDFSIDGKNYEAGLGEVLDPGDELEAFIYFSGKDLGGGAEKLKKVKGEILVGDDDSSEDLKTYSFEMD